MVPKIPSLLACAWFAASAGCQSENAVDEYFKISDMEPGSSNQDGACRAVWVSSIYNGSQTARIHAPTDDSQFSELELPHATMPGVLSTRAAHLWTDGPLDTTPDDEPSKGGQPDGGAPAERLWGANTGVYLGQEHASQCTLAAKDSSADGAALEWPMDLSGYSGLVFWAKAARTTYEWPPEAGQPDHTMAHTIRVLVRDRYSDEHGGLCTKSDAIGDTSRRCWNAFSATRVLTESFARYEVDFSSMWRDSTWGYPPPGNAFDLGHVYSVAFEVSAAKCVADKHAACVQEYPPLGFDVWIDDVYLVKHHP